MKRNALVSRCGWLFALAAGVFAPMAAQAVDGSEEVTGGGVVEYTGADRIEWVQNASGGSDLLIYYTAENATVDPSPATFTFPGTTVARILAVGGGGGGGGAYYKGCTGNYGGGGGGGAGGFAETNGNFAAGVYSVSVGAGGAGGLMSRTATADFTGGNGGETTLTLGDETLMSAKGGGGGGGETVGKDGASGGGGSRSNKDGQMAGGKGVSGQGHDGGVGDIGLYSGGGGGAGAAGAAASATVGGVSGGVGGDGKASDITGKEVWYAGGGGGGFTNYKITDGAAIPGGKGGGGKGGYGKNITPTGGAAATGGGGGGCDGTTCNGAAGGSGVLIVRVSGALAGGLERPTNVTRKYDGKPQTSYANSPFYTVTGDNTATEVGVYAATVKLNEGFTWADGGTEDVKVLMTIYSGEALSATVDVTGAPISFVGAAETNWVKNASGGYDFLIKFTEAGSFTLPGSSLARVFAVGGGGGGGGAYYKGCTGNYGGGGGGGAGGIAETNDMFGAATYVVGVGAGGAGGKMSKTATADFTGGNGGDTRIYSGSDTWLTALGGGGGGGESVGKDGASGGGGSRSNSTGVKAGGKGVLGLGHDGGVGDIGLYGGGGGGAGAAGAAASATVGGVSGGVGGDGKPSDIAVDHGTEEKDWPWYAGGGGGGFTNYKITDGAAIPGGKGGGGSGGYGKNIPPTGGAAATGGGGGGCDGTTCNGGAGGSGVVYVRISAAMRGELKKPEKVMDIPYDGNAHTSAVTTVFYDVEGENIATDARDTPYVSTVTLRPGCSWPGGDTESPITVTMTIRPIVVSIDLSMESWDYVKDASQTPDPVCKATPDWIKPTIEYATAKDAPDDQWSGAKPVDVGDYWVRARLPESKNYRGETAYASFTISKRKVTFSDLFQKDWMEGTPDEAIPKPRCAVDPDWVKPVYEYGAEGSDPLDDTLWKHAKPTERGTWAIRARAPDKKNYDYTPVAATFRIVKGRGGTFVDYVEIEIDGYTGTEPSELTNFPYRIALSEETPYGFLYSRAGEDGNDLGATDADGNDLDYRVELWDIHGESTIFVKVPLIGKEKQTIRLYWMLRPGATTPDHHPEAVFSDWTKDEAAKAAAPGHAFDLVVRNGCRVNYWKAKPTLSKAIWGLTDQPGVLTPGELAEGDYVQTTIDPVSGRPVAFPPMVGGSYRLLFTLDDPNEDYEPLEYHIDFAVTSSAPMDDLQGDAPSLTANGRVLLANDDSAFGHEVSGQAYWRTDPETQPIYWEHSGTHGAQSVYPHLRQYAGSMHRLSWIDEGGATNLLWRLENVILGNLFNKATLEGALCFLPWSPTGLPISSESSGGAGQRDESGWLVLRNTTAAAVYSPCYTNGIGTIYFDAVNTYAVSAGSVQDYYGVEVDFATNVWDEAGNPLLPTDANCRGEGGTGQGVVTEFGRLTEACWHPATLIPLKRDNGAAAFTRQEPTEHLSLAITKGGSTNNFYRVCVNLDCQTPVRFRIRRASAMSGSMDVYNGYVALDNVIVSYPKSTTQLRPRGVYDPEKGGKRVVGQEGAMSVPYPALTDGDIFGLATNTVFVSAIAGVDPRTLVLLTRMHYRWRYGDQAMNDWRTVDLSPFDDFHATEPLKLPYEEGDVEFFYESFLHVPYYQYYDYSGLGAGLDGQYTEEVTAVTNTYADVAGEYARYTGCNSSTNWFFRFRQGKSDWDEISVILDGARHANQVMELIGDHTWRGLVQMPTNVRGKVTFKFNGLYRRGPWGEGIVESDRWWYPVEDVDRMPFRGETGDNSKLNRGFEADGASNYMEFLFNDESGAFTLGHAEYQNFNAWHDAHREDKKFVGTFADTSGVNVADMVVTNANMRLWNLPKLSSPNWDESFEMANYIDEGYPKYTDTYMLVHKMPHQWNGENGIFVDAKIVASNVTAKTKDAGIAWQMRGNGLGNVTYTQNDLPSGLDKVTFKARLAQTVGFHDFSTWDGDGSSTLKNYTFVFPALLSAKNGNDCAPGATMSVVGYYRERRGCYEFRVTRGDTDGLMFSIYKWRASGDTYVAECLGSQWFKGAAFIYNCTDNKPAMYGMFISIGEEKSGQNTIIGGLSLDRSTPNGTFSRVNYRAICCVDKATDRLTSGGFGALSSNCNGMFMDPRHYDTYQPQKNISWKTPVGTPYPNYQGYVESAQVTYAGNMKDDRSLIDEEEDVWGFTPGRSEFVMVDYSNTYRAYGIRPPTDLKQTVGVYLKTPSSESWNLYKEVVVDSYGFKDTPFTIDVRTNQSCHVMLKAGAKSTDVTVWQIAQTAWNGEDIGNLDGTSRDFVYTQSFITEEVIGKTETNHYAKLQPARADAAKALSLRSPLLNGLGMVGFSYKDVRPGAEIWVQMATNVTSSTLSGTAGYNHLTNSVEYGAAPAEKAWVTLKKYTYDDLVKAGSQVYYLGWHYMADEPYQSVFRITVPPAVVAQGGAKAMTDPEWGSITITDFYVHDEPAIDTRSWMGWNLRTVGDATDSERRMFLPDTAVEEGYGTGMSAGLNNSTTKDIAGDPSEFDKTNPTIQSPTFGRYVTPSGDSAQATIGQVRFKARLYDADGPAAKVSIFGVKNGASRDWGEPLATFTIDKPRYAAYDWKAPARESFAAIRLVVEGVTNHVAGVQRVLLDEVVVSEKSDTAVGFYYARPFRTNLDGDGVVEDILEREQQPLCNESWGVQTKLKIDTFGNEVDVDRGFKVTFRHFVGAEPWGYDNWKDDPRASREAELAQVGARGDLVFRSTVLNRESIVSPQTVPGTVVQYVVTVYYYEKGGDILLDRTIPVTATEGEGWCNPAWYNPVDRNRKGDRADGEWKDATSPYAIIDTISPGRAWINEVNYNDGTLQEHGGIKVVENQFIELAVPWGVDMTDWTVRLVDFNHKSIDLAVLGRGGIPATKRSGEHSGDYGFLVLQSPNTEKAGGIRDPEKPGEQVADGTWSGGYLASTFLNGDLQYDEPYQLELVRPSGVVEHQFVIAGTNEYRAPIHYSSFGYKYDGTNLVNELNDLDLAAGMPIRRFYVGEDVAFLEPGGALASMGVEGAAHGEDGGWSAYQTFTPGRKNERQDALTGWFIRPNGESCWVYTRVEGEHLAQRIGDDVSPDTYFVLSGKDATTNIEYTVANWYQVDRIYRIENDVTNVIEVGRDGGYTYTVGNVTCLTYIVATESLSRRLIDAGLDPADRYTPTIMRWLEGGMANGRAFANPTGEIRPATYRGLSAGSTNVTVGLKGMYLLDMDPTEGGWWIRGGMTKMPQPVHRQWHYADGTSSGYTNVTLGVTLYLSNDVARAGVARPEVYAPPRLQGPNGERSDDLATYANWTGVTFKVEGFLPNGKEFNKGFLPFRWFVFGKGSFDSKYSSMIEVLDPFQAPSIGVTYGWPAYKDQFIPMWRWNLNEGLQPVGVDLLKADSTYEGKAPFAPAK